ncbi:MAG: DNA-3-methyladenine glycosylase family protein [Planctomycetota bacterium]
MSFDAATIKQAVKHLRKSDVTMGQVIRAVGPFALKTRPGGYAVVVRSILSQQISTAAAETIRKRLESLLPKGHLVPASLAKLTDDQLQSVGISGQKRSYIRDLTRKTLDGTIDFRRIAGKNDEDAIEELVQVKGIGRWTAQMYLIFSLGRLDVFAPDDLGLQNAIRALYATPEKPEKKYFEAIAESWAPYRTVASWYLWRSLETK